MFENKKGRKFSFFQLDFFRKNKKGSSVLVENVVFIILNVVFLSILILFITNQSSSGRVLEERYAKEIALITDYAKPEMIIKLDMRKGLKVTDKNSFNFENALFVEGNIIFVKFSEGGGYSYSFFNSIKLNDPYPETNANSEYTGFYFLTFSEVEHE